MRAVLSFLLLMIVGLASASAAALHDAARSGDVFAIAAALDGGADVNADDGGTALYIAARRGHLEAVRLLIKRGAEVNAHTKAGTALLVAVEKSKADVIKLLLEKGADPLLEFGGDSMLHVAARGSCLVCLKALIDAGADVNAMNMHGETPLHVALRLSIPKMAEILRANGAVPPKPAPILDRLRAADVGEGGALFARRCSECHAIHPSKAHHWGPNMWGLVGRAKASQANFSYSPALRAWGGNWSYDDLNTYIFAPKATVPGISWCFPGLPDDAARANLIAYLRTLSDTPQPLP
jgi:cytochrome c